MSVKIFFETEDLILAAVVLLKFRWSGWNLRRRERWIQANASKGNGRVDWWTSRSCTRKSREIKEQERRFILWLQWWWRQLTSQLCWSWNATSIECLHNCPTIKKLFLICNTVLSSSAPVEKLFCLEGVVLTPKWNRLTDWDLKSGSMYFIVWSAILLSINFCTNNNHIIQKL